MGRLSFLSLSVLFLFSCGGTSFVKAPQTARIIERVPFDPQESYQCGPASLAGILSYWGEKISPEDIAAAIYSRGARGTLDIDLVSYAGKKGWAAKQYRGSLPDIQKNIDVGRPLLVLVDYGFWVYERAHFMVVVGYDDEKSLIVNSGKEQHKFIPMDRFLKTWERTKFWTLLVTPE